MSDWFAANEYILRTIVIFAILAFSVQLPMRAGTFSLAGVGCYGIGSYTAAYLVLHGQSTFVAIGTGLLFSGVAGLLLARLLVRLRDLYLAMSTLAFTLLVGVVAINWTSVTGGPSGLYSIPVRVSLTDMLLALVGLALLLAFLETGIIGRIFEATREDEQLAESLSIDTKLYRRFAFVLSAMLGSLAGSFHSLSSYSINANEAGFELVILVLAMVIIGGFTSWVGALIGAGLLVWAPLALSELGRWWPVVYGVGLLFAAVYVPKGIFGTAQAVLRRLRASRGRRAVPAVAAEVALK